MNLNSLEKLRNKDVLIKMDGRFNTPFTAISGDELADEIQAEVETNYNLAIEDVTEDVAGLIDMLGKDVIDWCLNNRATLNYYISRFHLPRPLFEDGEPAQWGECFIGSDGRIGEIRAIRWEEDGYREVEDTYNFVTYDTWRNNGLLKRPPVPDAQKRINDDATLDPAYYCGLYGIELSDDPDHEECEQKKTLHLLERQRMLLGRDAKC